MDRETWDRWCERGIFVLVLSVLIFGPLAYGAVRVQEFVIIQALTIAVAFLWILRLWINRRPLLFYPPICWAVIAFVVYAIIRHQLAPIEYAARLELIKTLVYAFLFFAILNNINRQELVHRAAFVLIGLALALSSFAIFQFITHHAKVWNMMKPEGYVLRGSGTFINPNHFAGFAEMILPVALAITLMSRFNHAAKIVAGYAAFVMIGGIAVTLSRGGWLASALMLIAFFGLLFFQRNFRTFSALALIVLIIASALIVSRTQWTQTRFKRLAISDKVDDQRFRYWNSAIQLWREDIWLGSGPGHYDYRFRKYRSEHVQGRPQYVHNDYLNTLADWGLFGLGIIVAFAGLFYMGVLKSWRHVQRGANDLRNGKSNKAAIVFGGSLGVLAMLFHSALDFNMQIPANAILAISLIAIVTTYLRFASEQFWLHLKFPGKILLTISVFAGIYYLGLQGVRQKREQRLLNQAAIERTSGDRQLQLLEKAFAVEPMNFDTAFRIGEIFRAKSWTGFEGHEADAQEAIKWFERSIELNPYNPFSHLSYGMCLDWLGKTNEATKYFVRAGELDPNGYYTLAHRGWHRFQLDDLAGAKQFFERSVQLQPTVMAESYLEIIEQKMADSKTESN